jgi:type IV secretory pathway protease TraF
LIKLIVGLPGEHLTISHDRLWIDGRPLAFHQPIVGPPPARWQLGPSEYFLLSYAATVGTDSRHFGPLPREAILGRASTVYWPPPHRRRLSPMSLHFEPAEDS